jgi:hypothetical protein
VIRCAVIYVDYYSFPISEFLCEFKRKEIKNCSLHDVPNLNPIKIKVEFTTIGRRETTKEERKNYHYTVEIKKLLKIIHKLES